MTKQYPKRDVFTEPVEVPLEEMPVIQKATEAEVKMLTDDLFDGCYLVQDVNSRDNYYLVPKEHLEFSLGVQELSYDFLEGCARPYMWEDEIREIIPSVQAVRFAILRNGLIRRTDLQNKTLAQNALYGAFPNRLPLKGDI